MKITERSFVMVTEHSNTIIVDGYLENVLRTRPEGCKEIRPILWFRQGLSCVVPVEVLMNVLDQIDMLAKHQGRMDLTEEQKRTIDWKQCWPITDGRPMYALAGLEY